MYPTLLPSRAAAPRRMARLRALRKPAVLLPAAPAPQTSSPNAQLTSSVLRQTRPGIALVPDGAIPSFYTQKPIGGLPRNRLPAASSADYCVFTSSPETGGVSSVEPCTAGPGGTPISAPLPTGYCVNPGNAANGSNPSVGPCNGTAGQVPVGASPSFPAAAVPTAAAPVPVTQPTNQPYVDAQGNIWTFDASTGQWQVTGNVSSALSQSEAMQAAPASSAAPSSGASASGGYEAIINWLDSDSLIGGIQNFWIVGGAVVGVYLLKNRGKR